MTSVSRTSTRPPSAFAVPAFRRLWVAGLVSDGGDWLLFIALPLVVLKLSGSALGTSLAFLLELVPAVVLAPFVARLVDRVDRRTLMVGVNVGQGLSLLPLLFVHGPGELPVIYGVIIAQAVFSSAFEPAKNALLPTLVGRDRIVSANALVAVNQDLGRLIGGPLGGVLLVTGGLELVVAVDLVSYIASAVLVATLVGDRAKGRERPRAEERARSRGLLALLRDRRLRGPLVVMAVSSIPQGLFVVLFVLFVRGPLGGTDADVGLLRGVQAIGAIVAGAALGFVASRVDVRRLAVVGVGSFAAVTLVIWNLVFVTHALGFYVALFILAGVPAVFIGAGLTSLLQQASDDNERGSVFTALGLVVAVGQAVGMLGAGLLTGPVGVLPLLEVQGGLYAVAAVLAVVLLPRATASARGGATRRDGSGAPASP
ncbi:MFS transporter [Frondihabitans cladoniiphilus]|uniref:MFS transporter n=1 Tax=Frondihabitans cladoniiphilus TaxID=715785 RepID=A0ABP8W990_9MICO